MTPENRCFGCMEEKSAASPCPHCGYHEDATPESLLHLSPGTILHEKYLLGIVLGQGGFGITYLAWDSVLNIKLAIKEYLPQQLATRSAGQSRVDVFKSSLKDEFIYGLQKFLEEARTLARFIEHPNVISVRDYFEASNTGYLVMNYIEGITLESFLDRKGGKLPLALSLSIFMPVLDALKEIHKAGILHRDISPDNLIIDKNGRVILIDFGAARQSVSEKSKSMSLIHKAGYSPEEQYRGKGLHGPWTDIYALAATFYRTITGMVPPESLDRLVDDGLIPPSQLNVSINKNQESIFLKALALRAEDRYQDVQSFQTALIEANTPDLPLKNENAKQNDIPREVLYKTELHPPVPDNKPAAIITKRTSSSKSSRNKIATIVMLFLLVSSVSVFLLTRGEKIPASVVDIDADYYINYEKGTITLGELPIGTRIVDPTWEWQFRSGNNYTPVAGNITKPLTWIIVAKNHYEGLEPHVTLLAGELIGFYAYDNSADRGSIYGSNHWGASGTTSAVLGLRPWLNSTSTHSGEGFYQAFSENFINALLATNIPNRDWENGDTYVTEDFVFIPSTTELGDIVHSHTYEIGSTYPYFAGADNRSRSADFNEEARWYWTRSPAAYYGYYLRVVYSDGGLYTSFEASDGTVGIRPIVNIKAVVLVSEVKYDNSLFLN